MLIEIMVEIIHLEGPECIGAHRADRYEDPAAHHNRHDFRHNMRFQLTANELELLSQECAVRADAVRFGFDKAKGAGRGSSARCISPVP